MSAYEVVKGASASGAGANGAGANEVVKGANEVVTNSCTGCSCTTKCAVYEDDFTKKIKKDLEKEGEAAVQALYKEKGVNGSSIGSVLGAISNGTITEQSLTSIMQKGFDEFEVKTGRKMSYGEMRELYG